MHVSTIEVQLRSNKLNVKRGTTESKSSRYNLLGKLVKSTSWRFMWSGE